MSSLVEAFIRTRNTIQVNYFKPSLEARRYEEPFWRYNFCKVGFWDFLGLNFFKQLDYIRQDWLSKRGRFEQRTIQESKITYSKHVINLDDIVREIFDSCDLIRQIYNERPKYLVLGHKHMQALNIDINSKFFFAFPPDYSARLAGEPGIERMFTGMKVICIPWMDGIILLPELEDRY